MGYFTSPSPGSTSGLKQIPPQPKRGPKRGPKSLGAIPTDPRGLSHTPHLTPAQALPTPLPSLPSYSGTMEEAGGESFLPSTKPSGSENNPAVDRTVLSPHLAPAGLGALPLPVSPSCEVSFAAGLCTSSRGINTASPFRDQDPGICWSPTCPTQTCWEHSGPPRAKGMSKGIAGRRSLSQYHSSHTGGSSHRPLPPARSQSPGLATGLCKGQENSGPSPLPSHALPSLRALPSWPLRSQSQPPWLATRDVKGHCRPVHPITFN